MAKKNVYLETTIASYLTAWPSRDLVIAARQQITREWWEDRREDFNLYVSQFVLDEAGSGDPDAARQRLALLAHIPLLSVSDAVLKIGERLISSKSLPAKATIDALHIAIAATNGMEFLLTWNCRHLANAEIIRVVNDHLRSEDLEPPVICTPQELMGG